MNVQSHNARLLTAGDAAQYAVEQGQPLTPSAFRAAAVGGRLVTAATTGRNVRLFTLEAIEAFLAERRRRRRSMVTGTGGIERSLPTGDRD